MEVEMRWTWRLDREEVRQGSGCETGKWRRDMEVEMRWTWR